jgi:hypothetical protein
MITGNISKCNTMEYEIKTVSNCFRTQNKEHVNEQLKSPHNQMTKYEVQDLIAIQN